MLNKGREEKRGKEEGAAASQGDFNDKDDDSKDDCSHQLSSYLHL